MPHPPPTEPIRHPGELLSAFAGSDFQSRNYGIDDTRRVCRLTATASVGSGHLDYVEFTDEFIAIFPRLQVAAELPVRFADSNWVRMHFRLGGQNTTYFDRTRHEMNGAFCNLSRLPEGMVATEVHSARQVGWVTVFCKAGFLSREFHLDRVALRQGVVPALRDRTTDLVLERCELPAPAWRLLQDIDFAPAGGELALVRCEAMVTELICLLLDGLSQGSGGAPAALAPRDLERLLEARRIIRESAAAPPTIAALARAVGTNRTALTRGFRTYFGHSVFDTIQQERMALATRLLGDRSHSIAAIADALGYGSASGFCHAFRRYYGVSPGAYRRH